MQQIYTNLKFKRTNPLNTQTYIFACNSSVLSTPILNDFLILNWLARSRHYIYWTERVPGKHVRSTTHSASPFAFTAWFASYIDFVQVLHTFARSCNPEMEICKQALALGARGSIFTNKTTWSVSNVITCFWRVKTT